MKKLVFLFTILLLLACSENESKTLKEMKSDKLLSESFTENELENLAKIVDFFETQIHLDNQDSKDKCYYKFNKKTIKAHYETNGTLKKDGYDLSEILNYNEQKKLYKTIDTSFFKEIWKKNLGGYFDEEPKLSKFYNLNLFGKYANFLKESGKEDELFADFYERFYIANDISFSVNSYNFNRIEIEQFKDIKMKLFVSIYYLTLNEINQFPVIRLKQKS